MFVQGNFYDRRWGGAHNQINQKYVEAEQAPTQENYEETLTDDISGQEPNNVPSSNTENINKYSAFDTYILGGGLVILLLFIIILLIIFK